MMAKKTADQLFDEAPEAGAQTADELFSAAPEAPAPAPGAEATMGDRAEAAGRYFGNPFGAGSKMAGMMGGVAELASRSPALALATTPLIGAFGPLGTIAGMIGQPSFPEESMPDAVKHRYAQEEKTRRIADEQSRSKAPVVAAVSQLASEMMLPGPFKLAKGASMAKHGAKVGAYLGALSGAGNSESLADLPLNTLVGGGVGGMSGAALSGAAKLLTPTAKGLADKAGGAFVRALGSAKNMTQEARATLGEVLRERGLVKGFDAVEDIVPRIAAEKGATGAAIGESLGKLDAQGAKVDMGAITRRVIGNTIEAIETKAPGARQSVAAGAKAAKLLSEFEGREVPLSVSERTKSGWGSAAEKVKRASAMGNAYDETAAMNKSVHDILMMEGEAAAQKANAPLAGEWGDLKRRYGALSDAEEIVSREINRNQANNFASPRDLGSGMAAGAGVVASGGGLLALPPMAAAMAASRAIRTRGMSTLGAGLNAASNAIESIPSGIRSYAAPRLGVGVQRAAGAAKNALRDDDFEEEQRRAAAAAFTAAQGQGQGQ